MRRACWTSAQLTILDMLIDAVCDDVHDINSRFDAERFKITAHYYRDRITDH